MMDEKGRVWSTPRIRPHANPDFCKAGSDHPRRRRSRSKGANRHLSMYDPATGKFTLIGTCFPTHHLNFADDANQTLWTSAGVVGPGVIGWLNREDVRGDRRRGRSRRAGRRSSSTPTATASATTMSSRTSRSIRPRTSAVDGQPLRGGGQSVRRRGVGHGDRLSRLHHPRRAGRRSDAYRADRSLRAAAPGYGPRGGDVDRNGVYWVALASGHLGSSTAASARCSNGPTATGKHCPEGWTLHQLPGPAAARREGPGQRGGELLRLGRLVRHASGSARTCRS